jgi:hypothetical protein
MSSATILALIAQLKSDTLIYRCLEAAETLRALLRAAGFDSKGDTHYTRIDTAAAREFWTHLLHHPQMRYSKLDERGRESLNARAHEWLAVILVGGIKGSESMTAHAKKKCDHIRGVCVEFENKPPVCHLEAVPDPADKSLAEKRRAALVLMQGGQD